MNQSEGQFCLLHPALLVGQSSSLRSQKYPTHPQIRCLHTPKPRIAQMESVLSCEMISKKFLRPGDQRLLIWVCLLFIQRGVRWGRERNVTGAGRGVHPNNLVSDNSENNINISLYSDSKNSTSRPWLDTLAHFHGTGERGTLSERNHWVCLSWPVWVWGGEETHGQATFLQPLVPANFLACSTIPPPDRQYRQTDRQRDRQTDWLLHLSTSLQIMQTDRHLLPRPPVNSHNNWSYQG